MSSAKEFNTIMSQIRHGKISNKEAEQALIQMIDTPEVYAYVFFQILTEIRKLDNQFFTSAIHRILNKFPNYRELRPYPFMYIFNAVTVCLQQEEHPNIRNFIESYATDKSPHVRAIVGNCLVEWGKRTGFAIIEEALLSTKYYQDEIIDLYAERVESPLGETQVKSLAKAMRRSDGFGRIRLISVCEELEDPRLVPILSSLLNDDSRAYHKWGDSNPICFYASDVLKKIDTSEARQSLEKWRKKKFHKVKKWLQNGRTDAYSYINKLDDIRFIPVLAGIIQNVNDADEELRAIRTLIEFNRPPIIDILIGFISDWRFKTRTHREYKIIPTPSHIESTQRGYDALQESIQALGLLKAEASVPTIIDVLLWEHHPDDLRETTLACFHALRQIGTEEAQEALKKIDI